MAIDRGSNLSLEVFKVSLGYLLFIVKFTSYWQSLTTFLKKRKISKNQIDKGLLRLLA